MTVDVSNLRECIDTLFVDINENSSESVFRAYINRSYYAIFHELRLAMHQASIDTNQYKTGTHNNLCWVLDDMAKSNPAIQKLAIQFRDFLTKRHDCDYDLDKTISWYDVNQAQKYLKNLPTLIQDNIK